MNCKNIQKKLYDFSKDEISDKYKIIIKNHLNICKKCQSEYEKIKKIKNIITENIIEPPNYILTKIKSKIKENESGINFIFNLKTALVTVALLVFLFSGLFLIKNKIIYNEKNELYNLLYNSYNIIEIDDANNENNYLISDIYDL